MLLVWIIDNKKNYIYFGSGQVNKSQLSPAGLGKRLGKCPLGLEPPQGLEEEKTPPPLIFNNPRTSIKIESAPDQIFLLVSKCIHWTKPFLLIVNSTHYPIIFLDRLKRAVDAEAANQNKTRLEGLDMLIPRLKLTGKQFRCQSITQK